jgi:hypothetical protein
MRFRIPAGIGEIYLLSRYKINQRNPGKPVRPIRLHPDHYDIAGQ